MASRGYEAEALMKSYSNQYDQGGCASKGNIAYNLQSGNMSKLVEIHLATTGFTCVLNQLLKFIVIF